MHLPGLQPKFPLSLSFKPRRQILSFSSRHAPLEYVSFIYYPFMGERISLRVKSTLVGQSGFVGVDSSRQPPPPEKGSETKTPQRHVPDDTTPSPTGSSDSSGGGASFLLGRLSSRPPITPGGLPLSIPTSVLVVGTDINCSSRSSFFRVPLATPPLSYCPSHVHSPHPMGN